MCKIHHWRGKQCVCVPLVDQCVGYWTGELQVKVSGCLKPILQCYGDQIG